MARGKYKNTDALQLLRALVQFAEGEGEGYPITLLYAGHGSVTEETWTAIEGLNAKQRRGLEKELHTFLRAVGRDAFAATGKAWRLAMWNVSADYKRAMKIRVELVPLFNERDKRVPRLYKSHQKQDQDRSRPLFLLHGRPRDVLLYQAATLLSTIGHERLRFCPAPDCNKAFIRIGRREYCSERCQRRVFAKQYDPFKAQPRRADKPSQSRKKGRPS